MQLKLCHPRDIHEGLFRRQPGNDLIYERTTVCECGLNVGFLENGCTLSKAYMGSWFGPKIMVFPLSLRVEGVSWSPPMIE
jgi:hypothetical protein